MVNQRKKISWDKSATYGLRAAHDYIRKDSVQNAIKVKNEIVSKIRAIPDNPEKYPLDKYNQHNDGTYRAFEQHRYRIVYRVLPTEIKVITIRHTSMEPFEY